MDIKDLSSIRFLKAEFPDITTAQIDSIIDAFERLKDKIAANEAAKKAQREGLLKAVAELDKSLAELGYTFSDVEKLKKGGEAALGDKKSIAPKYAYTDENGNACTWTGRGRTPVAFAKLLESGRKAEEFLIPEEQN